MPKLTIDLGMALLLILPGFLAYRFSFMQRADPSRRSAIWQVSEILEHSLYVHLLGVALVYTVHIAIVALGGSTHLTYLITHGPQSFLETYFDEAIGWYIGYPVYIVLASAVIGAYSVPAKVSAGVAASLRDARRFRLLRWVPLPGVMYTPEPTWHQAFRAMAEGDPDAEYHPPIVFVTMKDSGDIYVGEIASYPIALDTQPEKDFLITHTNYYQRGDFTQGLDLRAIDGVGAVLLNSRDVESIRVVYGQYADGDGQAAA